MSIQTVQIFINDAEIAAPKGAMLIEVADQYGIDIPRFCYHRKLSVAANCRMCMVEVEKVPKPLPACATPVAEGMRVYTKSPLALDAQKGTMEFLLINHPLDCPVCDQGGECELQDIAMGYGKDVSRYAERKRVVPDKDLGPLVSTDMTRCIHCTRCVRFGSEIAGLRELGAMGRGEFMEIGTYVERALASELSGNVIDVCPVGALNAKPSRMTARSWEMIQTASVAPHDGIGSNIYLHTLRNKVMRVVPRQNETLNEIWISDRDRFSYQGVQADDRATQPLLRGTYDWQVQDWDTCLNHVATELKHYPTEQIGVLASSHATLEELYLLQKVFRRLNIQNIDHRIHQADFTDQDAMPLFPYLGQSLASFEKNDALLLIGCDIRLEQPMLAHRVRKASANGCRVAAINSRQFDFFFANESTWNLAPQQWMSALAEVAGCAPSNVLRRLPASLRDVIESVSASAQAQQIFELLNSAAQSSVLFGAIAEDHYQASMLRALGNFIADITDSSFGIIAQTGNTAGAWLSGVVPHRLPAGKINPDKTGLHAAAMLACPRQGYILVNLEPEFDFTDAPAAVEAMQQASFVVMLTPYVTEQMKNYANVILPITTFVETDGTYVNMEGRWQTLTASISAPGNSRPVWKVLRVLANKFGFEDICYQSSRQIRDEVKALFEEKAALDATLSNLDNVNLQAQGSNLFRVSSTPIYAIDNVVRRAGALQSTGYEKPPYVAMCEQQARDLNVLHEKIVRVVQGHRQATLPLELDETLPMNCVWIQKSARQLDRLGASIAPVEIHRLSHA